jgi:hypothetical protein
MAGARRTRGPGGERTLLPHAPFPFIFFWGFGRKKNKNKKNEGLIQALVIFGHFFLTL